MSPNEPSSAPLAIWAVPVPQHRDTTPTPPTVLIAPTPTVSIDHAALGVPDAAYGEGAHPGPRTVSVIATDAAVSTSPLTSPVRRTTTFDGLGTHLAQPNLSADIPQSAAPTGTRVGSTTTLSARHGLSVCGRLMIFTATVTAASFDFGTPTGTVTFRADGGPPTAVTLCNGVAAFTAPLDAGGHTVTASYAGDTCFNPAPLATLTTWIWRTGF
ncbi:MAG: Ig-like domain-containing protein [Pseudonocardiaceae bacterium]